MLLDTYQAKGLLTVTLVNGQTSDAGVYAYRGDLVLKEGKLREGATNANDRNPPESLLIHSALLIENDKIKFISGLLPELNLLPVLVAKYKDDLAEDCIALIYVENIGKGMQVVLEGLTYKLIPYKQGLIWNELLEELFIEKNDLKGQSAEDKIATVYREAKAYKPNTEIVSFEEAEKNTIIVHKEAAVGAV